MRGFGCAALVLLAAALPIAGLLAMVVLVYPARSPTALCGPAPAPSGVSGQAPTQGFGPWDAEQTRNAGVIVRTAVDDMHLSPQAAVDAVAAAIQESGLRNLTGGDRDSLGLFQQRRSQGWGTPEQVLDPVYATRAFLGRLVQLPGWAQQPLGPAVQAVQRSADPTGQTYQRWAGAAESLVSAILGGQVPGLCGIVSAIGGAAPGNPLAPCQPTVTQGYGPTSVPGEPIIDGVRTHTGIDLACPAGAAIHSLSDGIAHVTMGWGSGFGNNVVVEVQMALPGDRAPQLYFIRYAHMQDMQVSEGARIGVGQVLGHEGSTGLSTGPHLHLEIDHGTPRVTASMDPAALLSLA